MGNEVYEVEIEIHLPKVHAVNERLGPITRPQTPIGEVRHVPHDLVHDLRQLYRVR